MFFRRKSKEEKSIKPKIKKGCLKNLIIGIIILVIMGIAGVFAVRESLGVYGINLSQFNEYVEWLNEDVNESQLATNPIKSNDVTLFKNKARDAGFEIYDASGNVNLNLNSFALASSITLYDYELGAMINESAKSENQTQVYTLIELSIVQNTADDFTLTTVVKFNLADIKAQIGKNAKNIPDQIYITSIGKLSKVGSRFNSSENEIFINQLSADKNKAIVDMLNKVQDESEDAEIESIKDINNYMVAQILTNISQKVDGATASLGNHTFTLTKGSE